MTTEISGQASNRWLVGALLSPAPSPKPFIWGIENHGWGEGHWATNVVELSNKWTAEGELNTSIILEGELANKWSLSGNLQLSEHEPVDVDDYLKLVPWQHKRPKFMEMLCSILEDGVNLQNFAYNMPRRFNVDSAVGVQLDQIGEWVGINRHLEIPLEGVYFSWGVEGVGWGQGIWKGAFDPEYGLTRLPDDIYRILIKMKIVANSWDGTKESAIAIWSEAFGGESKLAIQDHQDMSMSFIIIGIKGDKVLIEIARQGLIPLKPAGVRIKNIFADPPNEKIFAWGIQNENFGGWGEGYWPIEVS